MGQLGQMGQMGQVPMQMNPMMGMGQMGFNLPSTASAQSLPPSTYSMPSVGMPQFGSPPISISSIPPRAQSNGMWSSRGGIGSGASGININTINNNGGGAFGGLGLAALDDDVIPTAIVIKNIPFAVPREQLLGVMESLGAPLPYAFNYHHDNGVFRGLAFANFRAPEEAAAVVAALNGYDVQGRKLRVEYKKVLQPGEKDKIEREKALKRMRSIQFDQKEMPPPLSIPTHHPRMNGSTSAGGAGGGGRHSAEIDHSPPPSASSGTSSDLPISLDLNDPTALDIYSRVLVFKEDRMRDELAFSRSLTPTERRIVHLVASKLGLVSVTRGAEGETKYVVVTRDDISRPSLNSSSSSAIVSSSAYLSPYSNSANAESLSPSLRIKKSMPDLRGFNGPVVARDPSRSLTPQRSSGNLRGDAGGQSGMGGGSREYVSMGAAGGRRANGLGSGNFNSFFGSPIDSIPPVPPLPAGLGLHNAHSHSHHSHSQSHSSVPHMSNHHQHQHASSSPIGTHPQPLSAASHHSKSSLSGSIIGSGSLNGSTGSGGGAGPNVNGVIGMTIPSPSPDLTDIGAAPMRNPRGPAGEGRGFGLRNSASASGILRGGSAGSNPSHSNPPPVGSVGGGGGSGGGSGSLAFGGFGGGAGKRGHEVEEDGGMGLGQDDGIEMPRTRESIEL